MPVAERGMISLSEDEFEPLTAKAWKLLTRRQKKRILKRVEEIPSTPEQFWKSCKDLNPGFEGARRTFLEAAGWDPAGWLLMDWATLPNIMKHDFNRIWPFYKDMIREESLKLAKELAKSPKG